MEQLTCGFGSDDGGNESATYSDRPLRLATATAGLITIGMGDAVASTVGQRFGRIRWLPQSACNRKTVEGSLGGWLAMLIGWIAVGALVGGVTVDDGGQWIRAISIVSLGTALLEGLSLQNDNLLVPLLAAAMLLSAELA